MTLQDPQLVARFKIHLRRVTGIGLNTHRFFNDAVYAKCMVKLAEDENDETLVTLAVHLHYGSDESSADPAQVTVLRTKSDERTPLFGARGR